MEQLIMVTSQTEEALAQEFQENLMQFVRGLGLHRADATPCGFPVSLAEACAMVELMRHEPISQRELCSALHLEKSTVSRLVVDLERRGWVERERSSDDARVQLLQRTHEGSEATEAIVKARNVRFGSLLQRVSSDQRDLVVHAMKILAEVIQDELVAADKQVVA
jgi:DNA-binding MarR family transcriptional regulator